MEQMKSSSSNSKADYSKEELAILERSKSAFETFGAKTEDFSILDSGDFRTKIYLSPSGVMKCEVVIDASVEECAAFKFNFMSRANFKMLDENKDVLVRKGITEKNNNHNLESLLIRECGIGARPRQFLVKHIWKKLAEKQIIIGIETINTSSLLAGVSSFNQVEATNKGFVNFVELVEEEEEEEEEEEITIPTTKMTVYSKIDLNGNLPTVLSERVCLEEMSWVISMRRLFSKDFDVDLKQRKLLRLDILGNQRRYSKMEVDDVERANLLFRSFQNEDTHHLKVNVQNDQLQGVAEQNEGKTWCKLSASVRCGGIEALAFLLSVDSRSLMNESDATRSQVVSDQNRLSVNDKGRNNMGFTRVVQMENSSVSFGGVKSKNKVTRRIVWKVTEGGTNSIVYMSPTSTIDMIRAPIKRFNSLYSRVKTVEVNETINKR